MFFLLLHRTIRVLNYHNGSDKFAPRTTLNAFWTVSGPFTKRSAAERAASNASKLVNCLSVEILTTETLLALYLRVKSGTCSHSEKQAEDALRRAVLTHVDYVKPAALPDGPAG